MHFSDLFLACCISPSLFLSITFCIAVSLSSHQSALHTMDGRQRHGIITQKHTDGDVTLYYGCCVGLRLDTDLHNDVDEDIYDLMLDFIDVCACWEWATVFLTCCCCSGSSGGMKAVLDLR